MATSAVDARLAHQLRFCEAEAGKAAYTAQQAEERIAQRDARRGKALAHNEVARARRLELEASAEVALARLVEKRRAMTAGMAPEEVGAMDAARDAQSNTPAPRGRPRRTLPDGPNSSRGAGTVASTGTGPASGSEMRRSQSI